MTTTIELTPVQAARIFALKGALKMEIAGLRGRGRTAYSIIKQEFGFKGNKQKVFEQIRDVCNQLLEQGAGK